MFFPILASKNCELCLLAPCNLAHSLRLHNFHCLHAAWLGRLHWLHHGLHRGQDHRDATGTSEIEATRGKEAWARLQPTMHFHARLQRRNAEWLFSGRTQEVVSRVKSTGKWDWVSRQRVRLRMEMVRPLHDILSASWVFSQRPTEIRRYHRIQVDFLTSVFTIHRLFPTHRSKASFLK